MLKALTKTQRDVFNLMIDPEMNQNKISKILNVTRQAIYAHCRLLKKKGYLNEDNTTTIKGRHQFIEDYNRPERIKKSYANKRARC